MKTKRIVSLLLTVLMACSVFAGLSVSAADTTAHTYTVVGDAAFLGETWNPACAANDMTLQADGTYVKTYADVAAGVYQLKVAEDHAWTNHFGATLEENNNIFFEVPKGGATELKVVFTLEGTKEIEIYDDYLPVTQTVNNGYVQIFVDGSPVEAPKPPEETFHAIAGAPELCNGVSWDPAAESNRMTLGDDGVYFIEYTDIAAGSYEFKITTNGAWDKGDYNLKGNADNGGPNAVAEVTADQAPATVRVEFAEGWGHGRLFINGVDVTPVPTTATTTIPQVDPDRNTTTGITYKKGFFTPPKGVKTQRLFFEMPVNVTDNEGNVHNWMTFANATGTCHWWDGKYACESWQYSYQMRPAGRANTYYIDAPKDATTVIFSNGIDGGEKGSDNPNWGKNYQTVNIGTEYYDPGESANYPEGLPSFDNMIYIPDVNNATENEFSGYTKYGGEWYYLHADGKTDFENKGDIFVPKIVPVEATMSTNSLILETNDTTTLSVKVNNGIAGYTEVWSSDDESVATVDQNGVVTAVGSGTTTIKVIVTQPDNSTFAVATCKVIVKSNQTISIPTPSYEKEYGDDSFNLNASAMTDLSYFSSNTDVVTVSSDGTVTIKGLGSAKITIKAEETDLYYQSEKAVSITVNKGTQTISTPMTSYAKKYGDDSFNLNASAMTRLSYLSSNTDVVTVSSDGIVNIKGCGSAEITIKAEETDLYYQSEKTVSITVNKGTQNISTPMTSYTKEYGDDSFNLNAIAMTGMQYSSSNTDVVTVSSNGTVTIKGLGSAKITITAKETDLYKSAQETVSITVNKGIQSISIPMTSYVKQYGDDAFNLNASAMTGLQYSSSNTDVVTVSSDGAVTIKGCGSAKITIKAEETDLFYPVEKTVSITVNKGIQGISIPMTSYAKQYGEESFNLKASAMTGLSYLSSNTDVVTISSDGTVNIKGCGSAEITITAKGTNLYNSAEKTVCITVNKAIQSISLPKVSYVKQYGDKPFNLDAEANTGLQYSSSNSDVVTVSSNGTVTIKGCGSAEITITAEGTDVYNSDAKTVKIIANKASQKITAKSYTKTYGSKSFKLNAKSSGGKLTYYSSDKKVITVSSNGVVMIKGCGKATITIKASTTSKYQSATKKVTITVKPCKVRITGRKGSKVFFQPQGNVNGYEAKITKVNSSFKKNLKLSSKSKYLAMNKYPNGNYKIQIRAYKKVSKTTYYGAWSTFQFRHG